MNFGRISSINILHKVRQLETLVKPAGSLVQRCGPMQFPKSTSSFANLNRCTLLNASSYPKCHVLSKLPAQLAVNVNQIRAASAHGYHVRLWMMEKMVSAALLALIPAALLLDSKIVDVVLAAAVVMHTHWGLEAVIIDYARPIVVGNIFPKIAMLMLNVLSVATLAGLLVLIYNGPGLTKVIKQGWGVGQDRHKVNNEV